MANTVDAAIATMIANYEKNTGKPLEAWVGLARKEKLAKHGEIVKWLKEKHAMGHGYANLVAQRALAGEAPEPAGDDLLKGVAASGRLEASGSFNAMVSHRVRVTKAGDIDAQLIGWLRAAYDQA